MQRVFEIVGLVKASHVLIFSLFETFNFGKPGPGPSIHKINTVNSWSIVPLGPVQ